MKKMFVALMLSLFAVSLQAEVVIKESHPAVVVETHPAEVVVEPYHHHHHEDVEVKIR
jgi:hypothetical protein